MANEQLENDDLFVHRNQAGSSRGTVCFLHGLGETGACFHELMSAAPFRNYRCLAVDLPGYGESIHPEPAWGLEAIARAVGSWLSGQVEGHAILVGHSMGGVLALYMAEMHRDVVAAVIDIEGNKSPGDCLFSRGIADQEEAEFVASGFAKLKAAVRWRGKDEAALAAYAGRLAMADPRAIYKHSVELVEASEREDLAARLAATGLAAHYIVGKPDGAPARSVDLATKAGLATRIVEPAGHWPFVDQPDIFRDVMAGILAEVG